MLSHEQFSFNFGTTFISTSGFNLQFEFEFQMGLNANDAYAQLIMMTWHCSYGITVVITGGCYNSPPLTRILVPRIQDVEGKISGYSSRRRSSHSQVASSSE